MKITSVNNELIKNTARLLKSKHRDENELFLIEGEKGVNEAIKAKISIERIFILENSGLDFTNNYDNNFEIIETTEAVLSKISDAKTAPKVVAVAKQLIQNRDFIKESKRILLLESIKDAGNLGTILRTASAFGFDGIILYGDTVDLYNPKCVRSSVGNLWKIPVIKINKFEELKDLFLDFEKIATLPSSKNTTYLNSYIPAEKTLLMFGSEADGLSQKLKDFATKNLTIEMADNVESLNLSVSVAILLYQLRNI